MTRPVIQPMTETILQEAQRLVHGDRQGDYGHPYDDYGACDRDEHVAVRACLTKGWLKYHHEGLHATLRLTDTGRRELGEAA